MLHACVVTDRYVRGTICSDFRVMWCSRVTDQHRSADYLELFDLTRNPASMLCMYVVFMYVCMYVVFMYVCMYVVFTGELN